MMIDTTTEKLIPLSCVSDLAWLPKRRGCKGIDPETIRGWSKDGRKGIRLEVWLVGGTSCTTEAALLRFFERLSQVEQVLANPRRSNKPRARPGSGHAAAMDQLREMGIAG